MSRTVTALFDSRAEAETARARFIAQIKTRSTRIIAKDTLAALDSLDIDPKHASSFQGAIREGGHLLVFEVEAGQDPKRIVAQFEQPDRGAPNVAAEPEAETPTYGFTGGVDESADDVTVVEPEVVEEPEVASAEVEAPKEQVPATAPAPVLAQPAADAGPSPRTENELRIGMPIQSRGGARVRSVIRETPAEEQVELSEEHVDVEHRPSERRLSDEDVKAGGLLMERTFEIREMREEPVITKEAFVREEVIVRKTVQERTETVRDTVRRTDFELEELSEQRGS
ncbi:MAG TPA: YsnF/AvaK domain-containing protein [Sphingomicrobium sp.]|nr:YsnF/AvaK domain-containing protein [Sphingomicrobium sp.]